MTIGNPLIVTRCQGNVVQELDSQPPLEVLRELYGSLPARDQELFRTSLFVGVEMRQDQVEYRAGELLVRNLVGMDPDSGALAIGAPLHPMQVVQFLLRDARTATEDLERMLDRSAAHRSPPAVHARSSNRRLPLQPPLPQDSPAAAPRVRVWPPSRRRRPLERGEAGGASQKRYTNVACSARAGCWLRNCR